MPERPSRLGKISWATLVPGMVFALVLPFAAAQQVIQKVQTAPGTKDEKAADDANADAIALPRNPESKRLIQAAQDYIKKKEWRIAAECLQNLLENPDDSFIEVRRKDLKGVEQDVKVSVREEANRIIGELPADGLESYQLQYGQAATNRLREAVERADPAILAEVSQRYFHTKPGLEATNLLGTYHLDRGQYLMASLCFERLLARPDADKLPPKTLFKAALAYRRAGDTTTADKLLAKIVEKVGRGDVAFNRVRLTLDQLRAEFNRDIGGEPTQSVFDWPLFRGNTHRNARSPGSTAYLNQRWAVQTIPSEEQADPGDKPAVTWIKQHLDIAFQALKDRPILPAFFPITAGNRLLVRTYDGVSAYALADGMYGEQWKKAGTLLWQSSAKRSLFATLRDDAQRVAVHSWYNQDYRGSNVGPMGVFFENSVLGCISHDGRRVYFIDDLGLPPHSNRLMTANFGGQANFGPFNSEVYNSCLQTTDLVTGKLSWDVLGGKGPAPANAPPSAATELLDSFILSAPLPLGGKLYLLTEKNGEIRLVCLDPEKIVPSPISANGHVPELVWVQSLGTANSKLPTDALRRLQAAHLAYGDGILVCPTNVGAVVGVDLLTHSLVWAYSYRKAQTPMNTEDAVMWRRGFGGRYPGAPQPERWRPSAPIVIKDRVILTAADGTQLDCLNLRDGRRLWTASRDEADLYLGGVFDGRVIIVGRSYVKALDLQTGNVAWTQKKTGMPAGQGVAGDGVYYLPLASSLDTSSADRGPEICGLDIKTGEIVGRSKSREEAPGNLLFAGGDLISQSATTIAAFPLLKVKQDEINRALAKNPNDPDALTERGEMHIYDGTIPDAVADLRTALANNPPDEVRKKARSKLFEGLTRWLQRDFNTAEKYLKEFDELCKVDDSDAIKKEREEIRRRATYLELVGRGRERQGRVLESFAAYEQYGKLAGNRELVESIEEPSTKARPDIWSRGRIQALIATAKPEDRKLLEAEIARRWDQVRTDANLDGLRAFVSLYGSLSSAGMNARLELANRLIATNDPEDLTEAERVLAGLCYGTIRSDDDPAIIAQALDSMITICVRRGQFENAVGFYKRLGTDFPDVKLRDGRTGRELWYELPTDKRFIPYLETPGIVWPGNLSTKEQAGNFANRRETSVSIEPQGELQPFFERHRLVLEVREDTATATLRLLDRATNEERGRWPNLPAPKNMMNYSQPWMQGIQPTFDGHQPAAYARGHDLILSINNFIFAFDLIEHTELWRKNLYGKDAMLNSQENNFVFDANNNLVILSNDNKQIPLGRVAVVEASYVALLTREGLAVLDPVLAGPDTMWSTKDVSLKATVFGNDRHVFILDTEPEKNQPRLRVLNAANGVAVPLPNNSESLAKKLTEAYARKIRILRGQLLVSDGGGKAIHLIDPLSGNDVWRREFSTGTVVVQCDDPQVVGLIEPAGLFTLLNTRNGEVQFTSHLRPEHVDKLQSASLVGDRVHYYLALVRQPDQGMQYWSAVRNSMRAIPVNGYVYALLRKSGKQDWVSAKPIAHQYLVMDQMADLPLLLFTTQYTNGNVNTPERQGVQVTGVAKSTGKLIVDKELTVNTQFHALLPRPSDGKIELLRQDLKVIFQSEPKK